MGPGSRGACHRAGQSRTRWLGRDDVELLTHTLCIVTESFGPFLMVW